MKILILGHGRHGKDTLAEMLRDAVGLKFRSSSEAAAEKAVYPSLKDKYGYQTLEECYADRANHREEWRQLITDYNTPDKGKLCREILETSDCYVGMRCPLEYAATRDLFDVIFWVDAMRRAPPDPSMGIALNWEMSLIDNGGTLAQLQAKVDSICKTLRYAA
jgi:hypothetical protein